MTRAEERTNEAPVYVTTEEVAGKLRVTPQTVRALCEKGEIEGARKIGRQWRIPATYLMPQAA